MKTKAIHRITALTMAFLMFFTSVGFSVDIHYCKGDLKSFSLIGEASACHQTKKTCPRHKEMESEEKSEEYKKMAEHNPTLWEISSPTMLSFLVAGVAMFKIMTKDKISAAYRIPNL